MNDPVMHTVMSLLEVGFYAGAIAGACLILALAAIAVADIIIGRNNW